MIMTSANAADLPPLPPGEGRGEGTDCATCSASPSPVPSGHPPPRGEGNSPGTVATRLLATTTQLQRALNLDRRDARLEAYILAARALGVDRAWLIAHDRDELHPDQAYYIETLVARREQGEPVAYILGEKEFYGRLFKVTPDVLIPRPETELLVDAALERLPKDRPARVLDLGTGSGCIAITIALQRPKSEVTAVDISAATLAVAQANAQLLGVDNIRFLVSDWYARLSMMRFDMILSNPPYIAANDPHLSRGDLRHEPRNALVSGPSGLNAISAIVAHAPDHLVTGGWLLFEHGYDQAENCQARLGRCGIGRTFSLSDLSGQTRVTGGQWPGRAA